MEREHLIAEVKREYERLASDESQQHFWQTTDRIAPDAYYENVLGMVIDEIGDGTFDSFRSGLEVVEAVANDKARCLSQWDERRLQH